MKQIGKAERLILIWALVCALLLIGSTLAGAEVKTAQTYVFYVGATWCPPCRAMKRDTLPNKEVVRELNKFDDYYPTDIDKHAQYLADRGIRVGSFPTTVISQWTKEGGWVELDRRVGYLGPREFLSWLKIYTPKLGNEVRYEFSK
jgi:thiol-disulfide isomerase/thioredoxin